MKKPAEAKTILYEPTEISMGCKKYRVFSTLNSNDELFLVRKMEGVGGESFTGFHRVPCDRLVSTMFLHRFLGCTPLQFLQKNEMSGQFIF